MNVSWRSEQHQTTSVRAVIVCCPLDPYDAVGSTDDSLGPTRKADDDPMGKPLPLGKEPKTAPFPGHVRGLNRRQIEG
ncbi:Atp-Dependent Rna Helicase Ddx3X [Manis pentadactyla]|nr:Atp-Dependent Rna Helicase Ddx3X [Manis pentadactyla]